MDWDDLKDMDFWTNLWKVIWSAVWQRKTLELIAAIAAAVAAWYSMESASQSAKVAQKAQDFVEQSAKIQDTLARPRISVTGATLSLLGFNDPEESWSSDHPSQWRLQLHLKNSGDRDATPLWVAVASGLYSQPEAREISLVKDTDQVVNFEFARTGELDNRVAFYVAIGYQDWAPERHGTDKLTLLCVGPSGFLLAPSDQSWRFFRKQVADVIKQPPSAFKEVELPIPPASSIPVLSQYSDGRDAQEALSRAASNHCSFQQTQ